MGSGTGQKSRSETKQRSVIAPEINADGAKPGQAARLCGRTPLQNRGAVACCGAAQPPAQGLFTQAPWSGIWSGERRADAGRASAGVRTQQVLVGRAGIDVSIRHPRSLSGEQQRLSDQRPRRRGISGRLDCPPSGWAGIWSGMDVGTWPVAHCSSSLRCNAMQFPSNSHPAPPQLFCPAAPAV